jgi:tRNA 2-thiouridine synthesizing protein E
MDHQTVNVSGKDYVLDRHGYLDPPDQWNEDFAEGMARQLGIHEGLSEEHWKFIRYLRDKFVNERTVPVIVIACADTGLSLNTLRNLFPTGYHRGACKIAGINYAFMYNHNIWLTYESVHPVGEEHKVDELGFLKDYSRWNERFAHWVAGAWELSVGLTDKHWQIIHYLREYYDNTGNIPSVYEACRSNDIGLDEFGELFPEGYRRGACRAAGLPFFP